MSIAVMKQAHQAFEAILGTLTLANEQGLITDTIWFSEHETLFDCITYEADTLRTAIEQAEKQEPVAYRHLHEDGWEYYDAPTGDDCKGCQPLYTPPPAAPVQEPESFEQWNAKQHGDPEEIGLLQALRIAYCAGQDSVTKATPPAQPAPAQDEFLLRGILASELKCWHRLTEDEETNLLAFVKNMAPKPAPVQEPYGYVSTHTSGLMHFNKTFHGVYTDTATEIVAVYTHPAPAAQRQWVGLDDEQIEELFQGAAGADEEVVHRFARAIEAKLREKNGGAM